MAVDSTPSHGAPTADDSVTIAAPATERRTPVRPLAPESPRVATVHRDTIFRRSLVAADVCATLLALVLAFGGPRPATLLSAPITVLVAKTLGLYDRDQLLLRKRTLEQAPGLFHLSTLLALVAWMAQDLLTRTPAGRGAVLALWVLLFLNLLLWRMLGRRVAERLAAVERVMVVGESDVHQRLREKLDADPRLKADVVAHLPLLERRAAHGGPVPHAALEALVHDHRIHRVIVAPDGADSTTTLEVVSRAKALGVNVSVLPRICEVVGSSVEFDELGGMTLLGVRPFGLQRSSQVIKRAVDIAGAVLALVAAAPLMAVVAVAIRLDSRGPILFRQLRIGKDGKPFEILKFRTMRIGADDARAELVASSNGNGLFKVPDDPRVTRAGRPLRRTSLDELPQLWNVLRGEMSLVGPRPLILEEDKRVVGYHRRRLHLKPGLTGPWQVLGSPDTRVGIAEMVTIDYLYAANWSLWADVQVILRTVAYVLGGRGV